MNLSVNEILHLATLGATVLGAGFALKYNVGALREIVSKLDARISALEDRERDRLSKRRR